ncbi:mitochondrial 54S ribosomal protein mL57 NDAI_0H00380 [Naumovozyma dairenensis CBS 421]|uniref:RNase III domain-containing protein n=1 Tax=Naumovozyma dairenensis (strain ATCC 10597 / BCRC 20456 / CBS 421 / NBRC 0211 / NRRL Y-12639) TaxID=1071378 RepID=G0WEK1_NAUDC|nr:hypothetical protein NDAI_0H00380 [Naumovozyma dairenensis CBS 421]CCD26212.1 hypothetical protein NDAI_0H00380 [Naumovozyma dairenensis CBS 421]
MLLERQLASLSRIRSLGAKYQTRNIITYLHSGSRIQGLKRDPKTYLVNPHGLSYTEVDGKANATDSKFFNDINKKLNLENLNISIPNNILLQCLTHKSFAHGTKPYNEKLNLLGSQFLKFRASVFSIRSNTEQNINLRALGTPFNRSLVSKDTLSTYIKSIGLEKYIFWKKRDSNSIIPIDTDQQIDTFNGEATVLSTILNSIIGAILITNGEQKTIEFINTLLPSSTTSSKKSPSLTTPSLIDITNDMFNNTAQNEKQV